MIWLKAPPGKIMPHHMHSTHSFIIGEYISGISTLLLLYSSKKHFQNATHLIIYVSPQILLKWFNGIRNSQISIII